MARYGPARVGNGAARRGAQAAAVARLARGRLRNVFEPHEPTAAVIVISPFFDRSILLSIVVPRLDLPLLWIQQKFCWASALPRPRHSPAPPPCTAARRGRPAPGPQDPPASGVAAWRASASVLRSITTIAWFIRLPCDSPHTHTPVHHTTFRPFPCWRAQRHHKQPASIAAAASFRTRHRRRCWLLVPSLALGQQWLEQAGALTPH